MTKFYDGDKILSIKMTDTRTGIDFENDFFEVGGLEYNADLALTRSRTSSIWPTTPRATPTAPTATSTTPSMRTGMSWSPAAPSIMTSR